MVEFNRDERVWDGKGNAVFCKAKDAWGSYGNMAGGYAFVDPATGLTWKSSEAWYQAQRFGHLPALQEEIRDAANGFVAKKVAHARVKESRSDWLDVNVELMARAIELKCTNTRFAAELLASGEMEIVELSMRDAFWGAKPMGNGSLKGANVLGQLLMQQRAKLAATAKPKRGGMLGALAG
ncbi:NADAR family protein [Croceicoccus gelatinilyticus]|uniref:NADAR family protein n=1 Tax=Croceicoccus gelatinilyticus TaxID=2835536 RepID=UPI001BCF1C54|nr:NADAR family protein [Croceicoccus gelatinilyticus]MBS7671606.1 NADAR family protein [Croceicoccus gelatinilyticus]